MLVSVYRYNPERDEVPFMQDVEVDIPCRQRSHGAGCTCSLKEKDPTLAYRRSCREGVWFGWMK